MMRSTIARTAAAVMFTGFLAGCEATEARLQLPRSRGAESAAGRA